MSGANQEVDNDLVPFIYEWAGGAAAFEKLTAIFYRHVLKEPLLKPLFENMPPEHSHCAHTMYGESEEDLLMRVVGGNTNFKLLINNLSTSSVDHLRFLDRRLKETQLRRR